MRKCILLLVVVSLLFAVPVFAADTIKIGEIATLTGAFAAYGVAEVAAVEIAVAEINAAGGINGKLLEVTMYDCRTRAEDMADAARRLVEQDKVVAVIGPSGSGLCIVGSPIFNTGKVPHIGILPTNPIEYSYDVGNVRPFIFRICFLDPYQGRIIARFAAGNEPRFLNRKKAAILYNVASDYSQGMREFFIESFKEFGGTIVADEGCRTDDVDFRAQLTVIKNSGANVLVFPFMGKSLPLAVKQAREIGIDLPIIGGDGYGDFMWEAAGDALGETYWVSHMDNGDPKLQGFFRKYEAHTGAECQEFMNAVLAYDCVYWLKDAIERAGEADPVKIRDALADTKGLQLMHAMLTMDEFHNPKDKDGVILRCDPAQQKAVFWLRVNPNE